MYWHRDADSWTEFTLAGDAPVELDAPVVHVSHYEADAFARWAGARLPTEAEWEHAVAHSTPGGDEMSGVFGAVWQWTSSPYVAYPGFVPPEGAISEYNAKFMSNQMVLRGSCVATPTDHERLTYRNFFPPGSRWAFGGLRLAQDQ
jgi:formylglycine-generating enzyme required for sulfatase activity